MKHAKPVVIKTFWIALAGLLLFASFKVGEAFVQYSEPHSGEKAILYSIANDDDLQLTFCKALGDANKSILLIVYSLTDTKIIRALKSKAEEGINITVICDANASKGIDRRLGPRIATTLRKGKGLMHQKILVIDKEKVWIGSANMTPTSLKFHDNLVIGFDSPEIAHAVTAHAQALTAEGRIPENAQHTLTVGGQNVEMWFLPQNGALERLQTLIRQARKTVRVAMFTWTHPDLAKEVANAHKRGIETAVIMDRNSAEGVSATIADYLKKEGVTLRVSSSDKLLHHKFVIIDQDFLVAGSANWTRSAFGRNNDCFVVLHNLDNNQKTTLEKVWKGLVADSR